MRARTGTEWFLEIGVVVAGIWIALLANNWNLGRVERQRAQEMLRSILSELTDERAEIERVRAFYRENLDVLKSFPKVVKSEKNLARTKRLASIVQRLGGWEFVASKLHSYRAAQSSGALSLIREADVRKALAQTEAALDGLAVQTDAMSRIQIDLLTRDIVRRVNLSDSTFFEPADADDPRTANKVLLVAAVQSNFVDYLADYEKACVALQKVLTRVTDAN